jgi:curved DNA-binding protein
MEPFEDYYEILQVHPSAEPEVIEAAYKKLAQKYHPDVSKDPAGPGKMKKINIAHDVLRNPEQRRQYHEEWLQKKGGAADPTANRAFGKHILNSKMPKLETSSRPLF